MQSALPRRPVEAAGAVFDTVVLGEGTPAVVFVNGLGSPLEEWALVAPTIAKRSRVVCYDRRAAPLDGPVPVHDASQIAGDLHAVLATLGVAGPLVLVGHSWGGAVIRRYAADHPDQVAGLVLVDASHEDIKGMVPTRFSRAMYRLSTVPLRFGPTRNRMLGMLGFDRLGPAELAAVHALPWSSSGRTARAEYAGIGTSLNELARTAAELPPVPTRVLLAGGKGLTAKLSGKQIAKIRAVWEQATAGRSHVTLDVVPDSNHYICLDQPEAVVDAVEDVLGRV